MKLSSLFNFSHLKAPGKAPRAAEEDENNEAGAETEEDESAEGEEEDTEAEGEEDDKEAEGEEEDTEAAAKAAFRRGRAAEKARIGQILASPEAAGNPELAAHLACNSNLNVKSAIAALKVTPAAKGRGLAAAMAANPAPKIGGDGGKSPAASTSADWDSAIAKANAQRGFKAPA